MKSTAEIEKLDLRSIEDRLVIECGWTTARVVNAVRRYKRFLRGALNEKSIVTVRDGDLDEVWHKHILDSVRYHRDCEAIFGRYLHHIPAARPKSRARCSDCTRDLRL